MLMKSKYILAVVVGLLIAVASFIIPRLIFINVLPTTNTTLGDIANAIMGLQNAIYTAMGIEICVILAAMAFLSKK